MTSVPFDTLKLATKLEETGFAPALAKGMSAAFADVFADDLVTKAYLDMRLDLLRTYFDGRLEATKSETLKWMFGQTVVIIGAVLALIRFAH